MFRTLAAAAMIASAALAAPTQAQMLPGLTNGTCSGGIFNLLPRIVRKDAVAAIPPDAHVTVHEYCRGLQLNDLGNAAGLTRTIAGNAALSAALARRGWTPDDVVGIDIRGRNVDLYVHRY